MTKIVVRNGNLDGAIRTYKQKLAKDDLPKKIREKESYTKPGVRKRNAKKEAIKNSRKHARNNRD